MLGTWKVWWSLVFLGSLCAASAFSQQCGAERWTVKTGTDSEASQVNLAGPQPATIAELIALTPPNPIPKTTRAAPTEKTVFVVDATLTDYKFETGPTGDSDYHLVLMNQQGHTMLTGTSATRSIPLGLT